jgi:hypothetical protein
LRQRWTVGFEQPMPAASDHIKLRTGSGEPSAIHDTTTLRSYERRIQQHNRGRKSPSPYPQKEASGKGGYDGENSSNSGDRRIGCDGRGQSGNRTWRSWRRSRLWSSWLWWSRLWPSRLRWSWIWPPRLWWSWIWPSWLFRAPFPRVSRPPLRQPVRAPLRVPASFQAIWSQRPLLGSVLLLRISGTVWPLWLCLSVRLLRLSTRLVRDGGRRVPPSWELTAARHSGRPALR